MFMFLESEELQNKERKGRERREKKNKKNSLCVSGLLFNYFRITFSIATSTTVTAKL